MNEPRNTSELTNILAECLDAMDRGEKTMAQCLAEYPDYVDELRPLLLTAWLTGKLASPRMSNASIENMEKNLFAGASLPKQSIPRRSDSRILYLFPQSTTRLVATLLVAFFAMFGGTIAVSANSQPGDALYSVKRFWEEIILALSPLTGSKSELAMHFAQVRLEEAEQMAKNGTLSEAALSEVYESVYWIIQHNNGDEIVLRPILDNVHQRLMAIVPPVGLEDVHQDLLDATVPNLQNGVVQNLPSTIPPHASNSGVPIPIVSGTATFTPTPTLTAVSKETLPPTLTPTSTETPSPTTSPTATSTSRIPPTPTRTPSPTPSPTLTLTPLPTLTLTWTPLPLPGTVAASTLVPTLPPSFIPTETPGNLPTSQITPRERETQQSVYMTQTAQAQNP